MYYRNAIRTEEEIDAMLTAETIYTAEGLPTDGVFETREEAIAYAQEILSNDENLDRDYVTITERRIANQDERDSGAEWWPDVQYWTLDELDDEPTTVSTDWSEDPSESVRDFVESVFNTASIDYDVPMTIETARTDLANFRADGWNLPTDITPEAYMEIWNELIAE